MELIGDDHRRLPEQWVKWICDLNLVPQTPGTMRSRRKAAPSTVLSLRSVGIFRRRSALIEAASL